MLHQETKEEVKTVRAVIREWTTCDMCHTRIERGPYEVVDAEISLETAGSVYPESGSTETIRCDLCADCFTQRLVPWLESQGVVMQHSERDW